MRSPPGETTRWVAGLQTRGVLILSDGSVCLCRSLQEVFPCNPSEKATRSPSSVMRVRNVTMFASGAIAQSLALLYYVFHWTHFFFKGESVARNFFQPGPGVTKVSSAAKSPRFSTTFVFVRLWSLLKKVRGFFSRARWFTTRGFGRQRDALTVTPEVAPTACVETCAF